MGCGLWVVGCGLWVVLVEEEEEEVVVVMVVVVMVVVVVGWADLVWIYRRGKDFPCREVVLPDPSHSPRPLAACFRLTLSVPAPVPTDMSKTHSIPLPPRQSAQVFWQKKLWLTTVWSDYRYRCDLSHSLYPTAQPPFGEKCC